MKKRTRHTLELTLTAGLGAFAFLPAAYGQPAPAPAATVSAPRAALVPPRLTTFVEAVYPAAAQAAGRTATVELELMLDADGAVTDARAVAPASGDDVAFDEAAIAAARQFGFEPARRNGEAIPARIRYRYVFELKAPAPAPTAGVPEGRVLLRAGDGVVRGAAAEPTSADGKVTEKTADATSAPGEGLEFGATATIEAPPREVTKRTLKAEELVRVAGTRGDALKAIEYMPGVARAENGNVIVRGSAPADSEVQFEGAPVYQLYHFQGLSSFVNSRMLDHIDLYPGNFSARYGRKLGSMIDVGVRDPKADAYHGMADVNVVDSSLLVEGPIGKRVSVAAAAKRSNLDFFMKNLMPDSVAMPAAPIYWDYQVMASFHPTDQDKLRAMVFGSYDDFKIVLKNPDQADPSVRGQIGARNNFHRVQVQWQHQYSDAVEHEISVSGGTFGLGQAVGPELSLDVSGKNAFLRSEWRARLHDRVRLMAGLDVQYTRFSATYFGPAFEQQDGNPAAFGPLAEKKYVSFDRTHGYASPAAYLEMIVRPTDRWQLVPGVRVDHFGSINRWAIDPRLTSRFELLPGTTVKGGVGLYSQEPDLSESMPALGNPNLKPPRAQHFGFGAEQKVGQRLTLTAEGFYKRLSRLVVQSGEPGENFKNGGIGRIWGAEASARLSPSKATTGFVSYTLSRSRRNDFGESWRLFNWDQTHVLTVAGSLRLGAGWDLSSTFRFTSGNPMTPVKDGTYNANNDLYRPIYGGVNSERNPAFHRLDLRVEKAWKLGGGSLATYLDLQNIYNQKSPAGRTYSFDFRQSKVNPGLGIIPSIGLRGEL